MQRVRTTVVLVALVATACSGGTASGGTSTSTSTSTVAGPARKDVAPLPMLGPVDQRWSYLPEPVPVDGAIPVPDPATERTELENRRALVAARPVAPCSARARTAASPTPPWRCRWVNPSASTPAPPTI